MNIQFRKHRGQNVVFGINKVILTIVCLVVYGAMYPLLVTVLSDMALTGMEALIGGLIPILILLGIALIPLRNDEQQQQYQGNYR